MPVSHCQGRPWVYKYGTMDELATCQTFRRLSPLSYIYHGAVEDDGEEVDADFSRGEQFLCLGTCH